MFVIDYGNSASISNMLRKIGVSPKVSLEVSDVENADKIILPGVGSFDAGMRKIAHLKDALHEAKDRGVPILGICLGMQMMMDSSNEGSESGLGWFRGGCHRFRGKVPNMGWRIVTGMGMANKAERFYFAHSYHVQAMAKNVIGISEYNGEIFDVAIRDGNTYGIQFHPEKSHKHGEALLRRFVESSRV